MYMPSFENLNSFIVVKKDGSHSVTQVLKFGGLIGWVVFFFY